ncbi:hypothetical protein N7494_004542 [Penicillium frequentans]|uniref:Noranthrone monooxygenase n=1 Tax=Penicillium frequentans TaxID=3151616 RepID=A0AAD6GHE4_9EURO|nr:hypothetical protein N7494_004542 [Penicillium glabrum]
MSQIPGQVGIQAAAVIAGSFLSGAMMSISMITVPVLLDTSTQSGQLLDQFMSLYNLGHKIMPTLSVCTCAMYMFVAGKKRTAGLPWSIYALAAATTISMVPFTTLVMVPTNDTLFALHASSENALEEVRGLIVRWQWMHVARSLFPLTGAVVGFKGLWANLR